MFNMAHLLLSIEFVYEGENMTQIEIIDIEMLEATAIIPNNTAS